MTRITAIGLLLLALAARAGAQTVAGDRFTLNTGPCTIRSGSGAPEGTVTGKVCDVYLRTDGGAIGIVYVKEIGSGNTGWSTLTPGIPLDPTPGKVLASGQPVTWTATPSLTGITGAADLTLNPAGDVITDPAGRAILPGFGFTTSIGMLSRKYLAVHAAELWIETLVAQQTLATIGGRVVVAPTNVLMRDVAPGDVTIFVKYNALQLHVPGVETGSKLFFESGGKFEIMDVMSTAAPSPQSDGSYAYAVRRDLDGSGPNQWYAGDAMLDTGKTNAGGVIDLYASRGVVSGVGPSIVGSVRVGPDPTTGLSPRFALGNLNGVGYGHASDIYGFAAGDPNGPNIFADPVNGLHLRQGSTAFVSLFPGGQVTIRGDGNGVTNINGGNIAADTITGDKIAANTITAADLNATGFGDNVIKNGSFEPSAGHGLGDPEALAGWAKDAGYSTAPDPLIAGCCGLSGPGTMQFSPSAGYLSAEYLAVPVVPGQTYRVALMVYTAGPVAGALHVIVNEFTGNTSPIRRVVWVGGASPDVNQTSYTFLATSAGLPGGWQNLEYAYTVPAGVNWASLNIFALVPGVDLHVDDVEMQKQIGAGHIRANAITATHIAAGAITSDKIASGTGSNVLRNSECRVNMGEWYLNTNTGRSPDGSGIAYAGYSLLNESNTCWWYYATTTPSTYAAFYSKTYPSTPGARYEGSAYFGTHGVGNASTAWIEFVDASGARLSLDRGSACVTGSGFGGVSLDLFCRSGILTTAPPGTAGMRLWIENDYSGSGPFYTFAVRMFLGEAKPNQTQLSEWSPAGLTEINGGLITTGAILAQHIAAGAITADKIAAGAITADMIAARSITADKIAVGTLTATEIAARSLTADRIAVGAITATEIAARSLTADRIAGGVITGYEIAGNTITADRLNVTSLSAITANLGTVTAGTINGVTITGTTITGSTIYAGGSAIRLDGGGMTVAEGDGGGAARIIMANQAIWGQSNAIRTTGDVVLGGALYMGGAFSISGNGVIHADNGNEHQFSAMRIFGQIYTPSLGADGANVRALYYRGNCGCIGFWTGSPLRAAASTIREESPLDPLAVLRVPLVTYDGGRAGVREIGISAEALGIAFPAAVDRDAQDRPESVRADAVIAILLGALRVEDTRIAELDRRLKAAEAALGKLGGGR